MPPFWFIYVTAEMLSILRRIGPSCSMLLAKVFRARNAAKGLEMQPVIPDS